MRTNLLRRIQLLRVGRWWWWWRRLVVHRKVRDKHQERKRWRTDRRWSNCDLLVIQTRQSHNLRVDHLLGTRKLPNLQLDQERPRLAASATIRGAAAEDAKLPSGCKKRSVCQPHRTSEGFCVITGLPPDFRKKL